MRRLRALRNGWIFARMLVGMCAVAVGTVCLFALPTLSYAGTTSISVAISPEQAVEIMSQPQTARPSSLRPAFSTKALDASLPASSRVIVNSPVAPQSTFGAVYSFYYVPGSFYVLGYANAQAAQMACVNLAVQYGPKVAFCDAPVQLDAAITSKAVGTDLLDDYSAGIKLMGLDDVRNELFQAQVAHDQGQETAQQEALYEGWYARKAGPEVTRALYMEQTFDDPNALTGEYDQPSGSAIAFPDIAVRTTSNDYDEYFSAISQVVVNGSRYVGIENASDGGFEWNYDDSFTSKITGGPGSLYIHLGAVVNGANTVRIKADGYADKTVTFTWNQQTQECSNVRQEDAGGRQATVAVLDTGIDVEHPWFQGRIHESSVNLCTDKPVGDYDDISGHGTHVSGVVVKGTPDNVDIMAVRIFDSSQAGSVLMIRLGLDYAVAHGADVANLSLGFSTDLLKEQLGGSLDFIEDSFTVAADNGCVVCVSSGNESADVATSYPAASASTISVGSFEDNAQGTYLSAPWVRSYYSNYGHMLDFVAPGRQILSSYCDGGARRLDGTSMACPHLTAAAAVVKLANPDYYPWDVVAALRDYTVDLGPEGKDTDFGYGYVDFHTYLSNETSGALKRYQGIFTEGDIQATVGDAQTSFDLGTERTRGDGAISYRSTDESVAVVDADGIVRIVGGGNCQIVVTAAETDHYRETDLLVNVTVARGKQTVVVPERTIVKYENDPDFQLSASVAAPGDGQIRYVTNTNDVVDVTPEGKVHIKGVGQAKVYPIASATASYDQAIDEGITIIVKLASERPRTNISKAVISGVSDQTYDGKAKTPKPTVKLGTTTLKEGTDYTVSYKNNVNVGTATVVITGKGNYTGSITKTFKITKKAATTTKPSTLTKPSTSVNPSPSPKPTTQETGIPVYWLVHKRAGENLYTTDANEVKQLSKGNWQNKGIVWYAPKSGQKVYRLYAKKINDHHYTSDINEVRTLTKGGTWKIDSGEAMWYSGGKVQTYRLFNPARNKAKKPGTHRFATSIAQVNTLKKAGWVQDGVKMYGLRVK